ncbi:MAG: esterase family protein [Oscillospiraceae bacterium]|nr:esterase family protein [Oscillospiraceae bacterium]
MKKICICTLILAVLTGLIAVCAGCNSGRSNGTASVAEREKGTIEAVTIPAPSLSNNIIGEPDEQEICIYLPYGYASGKKDYPVIYIMLDTGNSQRPSSGNIAAVGMRELAPFMNNKIAEKEIGEMIAVTIGGFNKLGCSFFANSPVTGNWEDFVTKDVVEYVDSHYRTVKNSLGRGLAGGPLMGGFGALNIAMNTKGIYGYVDVLFPALYDDEGILEPKLTNAISLDFIEKEIAKYKDLSIEEAREKYLASIKSDYSLAYASAFAPDPEGKAPYVKLPAKDAKGEFIKDEVWALYDGGYGDMANKLDKYKDNLNSLIGLRLTYGTTDHHTDIKRGCLYLSEEMRTRFILHEIVGTTVEHASIINQIQRSSLGYFSDRLCGVK